MSRIENLVPNRIVVIGDQRRPLNEAKVADLAESMKRVGLLNPITIWRPSGLMPQLVAGHHRLEAAKRLKWDEIACNVLEGEREDADAVARAGLAEIDENLIRHELTDAERADLTAKRKAAYEEAHPETRSVRERGGPGRGKTAAKNAVVSSEPFAKETARITGRSERAVRLDASRAKALGPDLKRIARTSLDKGSEIDALAKMPPDEREPIIARAVSGEKVTARSGVKPPKLSAAAAIEFTMKEVRRLVLTTRKGCTRRHLPDLIDALERETAALKAILAADLQHGRKPN